MGFHVCGALIDKNFNPDKLKDLEEAIGYKLQSGKMVSFGDLSFEEIDENEIYVLEIDGYSLVLLNIDLIDQYYLFKSVGKHKLMIFIYSDIMDVFTLNWINTGISTRIIFQMPGGDRTEDQGELLSFESKGDHCQELIEKGFEDITGTQFMNFPENTQLRQYRIEGKIARSFDDSHPLLKLMKSPDFMKQKRDELGPEIFEKIDNLLKS